MWRSALWLGDGSLVYSSMTVSRDRTARRGSYQFVVVRTHDVQFGEAADRHGRIHQGAVSPSGHRSSTSGLVMLGSHPKPSFPIRGVPRSYPLVVQRAGPSIGSGQSGEWPPVVVPAIPAGHIQPGSPSVRPCYIESFYRYRLRDDASTGQRGLLARYCRLGADRALPGTPTTVSRAPQLTGRPRRRRLEVLMPAVPVPALSQDYHSIVQRPGSDHCPRTTKQSFLTFNSE